MYEELANKYALIGYAGVAGVNPHALQNITERLPRQWRGDVAGV